MGGTGNYLNYALYRNFAVCNQVLGMVVGQVYSLNNTGTGPNNTVTIPNPLTAGTTYSYKITSADFSGFSSSVPVVGELKFTTMSPSFIDTTVIHNITHHGNRPEVLAELRGHEEGQFGALNDFLTALDGAKEEGQSLLDRTMVLYGTCMGSANSHSNVNLPVLLAGGGFKHGQHLAFDVKNNYPLTNLYVSMLQRLGIEAASFSTSTGTMKGLELA